MCNTVLIARGSGRCSVAALITVFESGCLPNDHLEWSLLLSSDPVKRHNNRVKHTMTPCEQGMKMKFETESHRLPLSSVMAVQTVVEHLHYLKKFLLKTEHNNRIFSKKKRHLRSLVSLCFPVFTGIIIITFKMCSIKVDEDWWNCPKWFSKFNTSNERETHFLPKMLSWWVVSAPG